MKITVLCDNVASGVDFCSEHGLSLLIETKNHTILFDAGQSEVFSYNAQKLGIDLSAVDMAVLSHGHYDHSGGLEHFLAINKTAPVYVSQHVKADCYNNVGAYIGIQEDLLLHHKLIPTDDHLVIDKEVEIISANAFRQFQPVETEGMTRLSGEEFIPDDFTHEQYLLIHEEGKNVLFSGCSHKGIFNLIHWFRPHVFVGGFHFMHMDTHKTGRKLLEDKAQHLLSYPTTYYTGHCTGQLPFKVLQEFMDDRLTYLSAGMSITI